MEKMPNKSARRARGILMVAVASVGLTACSDYNFSGKGNEFVVRGVVTDPGHHSLKATIYEIDKAEGDAQGWFDDKAVHQIHDNCNCNPDSFWNENVKAGRTLDLNGNEIQPFSVPIGACVEFDGKIREHHEGKTYDQRPVYDVARQIRCSQS